MKTLKQFVIVMGLMSFILIIFSHAALAQDAKNILPLPGMDKYGGDLPTVEGASAQEKFYNLVFNVILNLRYVIGAIAIGMMVYAGIQMAIAQGNDEVYSREKKHIIWAILGLATIGFSGEIVRILSVYCDGGKDIAGQPCTAGGFLKDPNAIIRQATIFNQRTDLIITFIKYFIGSVAVLMIIRSGLRLITMGSKEDQVEIDKKYLGSSIVGLILIIISDSVINKVLYKLDLAKSSGIGGAKPGFDPAQGVKEIAGITNMVVSIVGPLAVLMLIYGAFLYVTSASNEERQTKAKRLIFATIVGILIVYGAFAIVSTIISGQFNG